MKKVYKVIGIGQRFEVKKSGREPYWAQTIYLVSHDDRVNGLAAESLFVPDRILGDYFPVLDDKVTLSYGAGYDGRAYLESIDRVDS